MRPDSASMSLCQNVPRRRTPRFQVRCSRFLTSRSVCRCISWGVKNALEAIEAALKDNEGRDAITALHGPRGVGKTTLAAAYAERYRRDYRATWWIRAQAESTLRADLVALCTRLGWVRHGRQGGARGVEGTIERLRHEGEGILLIFYNAVDADALENYLPRSGVGRVLITSNAHAGCGTDRNPPVDQGNRRRLPYPPHWWRDGAPRSRGSVTATRGPWLALCASRISS
jgi:hypothetical protein